ncbi:hypothetical protein LLB_0272 [Legionella longbeachae D-4968]|nr:hypothetical protein LLB_0272 [Legionella longbeachae D-4968]
MFVVPKEQPGCIEQHTQINLKIIFLADGAFQSIVSDVFYGHHFKAIKRCFME